MKRNKKDLVVFVKLFLGAIPVMDVPIENTNSFSLISGVSSSDCHVVENAEACRIRALGMMTWGSDNAVASI